MAHAKRLFRRAMGRTRFARLERADPNYDTMAWPNVHGKRHLGNRSERDALFCVLR
jgi:hypothetical protein